METSLKPLMLDVDTGVDDAAAIAYALAMESDLVAVTTVAGNVPIDLSTENTLRVLTLLGGEEVPVFRGASKPLVADYMDAAHVHGGNGLGGATLPDPASEEQELTAPEAIVAMADEFAGDLVFVSVGPLTNLAMALSLRPQIAEQIRTVVVMGGAYFNPGNISEYAEYNAYTDPDAAKQVFQADWNEIYAIGLDVTHQTALTEKMWEMIPNDADGAAGMMRAIVERTYRERVRSGFFLHDPLAVGVALDPGLVTTRDCAVDVITTGEERGRTVVSDGGSVKVAESVNAQAFVRRFCGALELPYVYDPEGIANSE